MRTLPEVDSSECYDRFKCNFYQEWLEPDYINSNFECKYKMLSQCTCIFSKACPRLRS